MGAIWSFVADPLSPAFAQRAALEVLLLSITAGVLGGFVVMRRLAFMSHALGHATFPAIVLAYVAGWSVAGSALVASLAAAAVLGVMELRPEARGGVAVAIVLSAAVALGAILVSDIVEPGVGVNTLLFGSVLLVQDADLVRAAVLAVVVVAVALPSGRAWTAITFDAAAARATGLPAAPLVGLLYALLAAAVAVSVAVVGTLLVSGLLVVPAAAALLVTRRVRDGVVLATAFAIAGGVIGLWLALRLDVAPGACIALTTCALFAVTALGRAVRRATARAPAI